MSEIFSVYTYGYVGVQSIGTSSSIGILLSLHVLGEDPKAPHVSRLHATRCIQDALSSLPPWPPPSTVAVTFLSNYFLLCFLPYALLTFQSKFCGDEKETTVHTRADSRRPVMLPASCGLSVPGEG